MYKPMSESAKQAGREAIKRVLEERYPGLVWTDLREGEEPPSAAVIFRINPPGRVP